MSLVAYDSSDESTEDEGYNCEMDSVNNATEEAVVKRTNDKLCLPSPKYDPLITETENNNVDTGISSEKIHFDKLPKPKSSINEPENIVEEDDIPFPKKEIELKSEKATKKDRAPVRITVPSLSDFKDVEEENEKKSNKIKVSSKGTKLFALLPPPRGSEIKSINNLIPNVISKTVAKTNQMKLQANKDTKTSETNKVTKPETRKISIGINYDSNSEDEDDMITSSGTSCTTDFFALAETENISNPPILDSLPSNSHLEKKSSNFDTSMENDSNTGGSTLSIAVNEACTNGSQKTLVSTVMNLPKEEILLKNKAEVGPKLPVPEQEYNIDTEGNVAFDDKAIEYLCGRRGIKRKNKEIEEANIIEINGEDIKPDEREWLVKALTEEPVQRPVSMQGGGVNSQSKKKHQITYLAHQAKAMEMELKNQWAQNRMTRKQTQSKYGF
ncbi:proline-rich protein PRCC [Hylaeus anthracinus]|uniref:proline-rich protein PRCC n=1 Tax=Hylaeus anthracinus TaxID=313031 RepID=UPI0023B8FA65|nr:proline-rich protein PRCC [Hylaeus anthracinus]